MVKEFNPDWSKDHQPEKGNPLLFYCTICSLKVTHACLAVSDIVGDGGMNVSTHWLSLDPVVNCSLKLHSLLKSYFLLEDDSSLCFKRLTEAFEDLLIELYLLFY